MKLRLDDLFIIYYNEEKTKVTIDADFFDREVSACRNLGLEFVVNTIKTEFNICKELVITGRRVALS